MLVENINYLRKNYPAVREQLKTVEESEEKLFQIEEAKKGDKTLSYMKDGKTQYFHSKYDPIREAQAIAEEYTDLGGKAIVFYGTGLGYHIEKIISNNPNSYFYIFEPIPELMEVFLSEQNLSKAIYKNLRGLSIGLDYLGNELDNLVEVYKEKIEIIELPNHKKYFEEECKTFMNTFILITREKRHNLATTYYFQKKWTTNTMKNLKDVLATPNIMIEKKGEFKDKPAIIVAAGPSLNEEIENLRYIKEHGLAYIFSVGSAINTLVHHNIYPHATVSFDPSDPIEEGIDVLGIVKEKKIREIPLIFGSSIGFRVIEDYPGRKYHMLTSQDLVSAYYLLKEAETMDIASDAPSIAIVTLKLLEYMDFNPIILVGQNLAYLGNKNYSEGIQYAKDVSEEEQKNALLIEDVHGNQIKTDSAFNLMRIQMELYIDSMDGRNIINTTKGGAKIKGTNFRDLGEVIDGNLKERVVCKDWLECKKTKYSKETIKNKMLQMDKSELELSDIIKEYNKTLDNMTQLLNDNNIQQLEKTYNKLNDVIVDLQNNDFFMTFALNMNKIYYNFLANAVLRYQIERNVYKKNKDLIEEYKRFIEHCSSDIDAIKEIYRDMNKEIQRSLED